MIPQHELDHMLERSLPTEQPAARAQEVPAVDSLAGTWERGGGWARRSVFAYGCDGHLSHERCAFCTTLVLCLGL